MLLYADIQPNLKSNTKVLQSGATHTVFNDSESELLNNTNISTTVALNTSNILPESEPKNGAEVYAVSQNATQCRRNRRRRNRRKSRKLRPVGGEDDVLVAVSKIFKNPTDSEGSLETNKAGEVEASLSKNGNSNGQESQSNIEAQDAGDDFGVDFTVDFDSYPELNGAPRIGDVLAYKVINIMNMLGSSYLVKINTCRN